MGYFIKRGNYMKNEVLVKCRRMKGMSQLDLAETLGVCKDYIYLIENNRRQPGFRLAKRMADLFGTTIDELFF